MSGWLNVLAARAAASGVKHKACILLWMEGGPSHKDTFDLKPGTDNGGPGLRTEYHATYYGAFVLDLDGNNIEACCHKPE